MIDSIWAMEKNLQSKLLNKKKKKKDRKFISHEIISQNLYPPPKAQKNISDIPTLFAKEKTKSCLHDFTGSRSQSTSRRWMHMCISSRAAAPGEFSMNVISPKAHHTHRHDELRRRTFAPEELQPSSYCDLSYTICLLIMQDACEPCSQR